MGGNRRSLPAVLAGLAAAVAIPQAAQATNGMLPHCIGVYACGMGGAGMALATDATKIASNPALGGRLGNELSVSLGWMHPDRTMDAQGPTPPGFPFPFANTASGEQTSQIENYPDGALAFNYRLSPTLAVGAAMVPGGGGETKYAMSRTATGQMGFGNAGAMYDSQVRIRYASLTPTVAWTPSAKASYGASVILGYMDFKSNMAVMNPAFTGLPSSPTLMTSGANELERVYGIGLKVGGVWDLSPQVSVAATASTGTRYQRLDDYRDLFIGPLHLPPNFGVGVTFRASPSTDIVADVQYQMWEAVEAIGGEQPAQGGFGWENQPIFALGVQHRLSDRFAVRAGWNYGPSPIPDDVVFANALFPAVIEHHFTAGATYAISDRWEVSGSAYFAPKVTQTDPGTGDMFSQFGGGTVITMKQYGGQVGLRWKF